MTNINTFQGDVFIHEYIKHTGDENNLFGFNGADSWIIQTGGTTRMTINNNGVNISGDIYIPDYIKHTAGSGGELFGFSANDTFKIATASTDRLTVNSSGNVGIGVTDPTYKLDVLDAIRIRGDYPTINFSEGGAAATQPAFRIFNDGAGMNDNNNYLAIQRNTSGTTYESVIHCNLAGTVTTSGALTVGANLYIPTYVYHTGDTNTYFGFPTTDQFVIATSGTTRMKILSDGLTAIGNHTPTRLLDVNGTANFRGTAYSPRFTSYYHTTGSLNTITNYDISVQGQFRSSITGSGVNLDTGWYLLSAQRGDGNPFESGSAHFYVHTAGPQRMTTFGQGGISFSTTGQNIRMTTSQNAVNYSTPYAIHLCKVGNTYATGI
jgi:hypothetical protein